MKRVLLTGLKNTGKTIVGNLMNRLGIPATAFQPNQYAKQGRHQIRAYSRCLRVGPFNTMDMVLRGEIDRRMLECLPHAFLVDIGDNVTAKLRTYMSSGLFELSGVIFTERKWDHLYESHMRRIPSRAQWPTYDAWLRGQSALKDRFEAFLTDHPQVPVQRLWSPEESQDWREVARVIQAFFPEVPSEDIQCLHGEMFRPVERRLKGIA